MDRLLGSALVIDIDGINSIDYQLVDIQLKPLFTQIMVDYDERKITKRLRDQTALLRRVNSQRIVKQ